MIPYTDGFFESQYAEALAKCLHDGVPSEDRTGVGTRRLQHVTFKWSGIAALRGKKLNLSNAVSELLWMMLGKTDLESLKSRGVNYWDSWVKPDGTFGPIYGAQMRDFGTRVEGYYDQLRECCRQIIEDPWSRRIIMSLWNPNDLEEMALPPCHCFYQFTVVPADDVRELNLHVTQRSADAFIGVPYDFLLFSFMLQLVALFCDRDDAPLRAGKVYYTCNDFHVYDNHTGAIMQYLKQVTNRRQMAKAYGATGLTVDSWQGFTQTECDLSSMFRRCWADMRNHGTTDGEDWRNIDDFLELAWNVPEVFDFSGYSSQPFIKAPVAV
jgi:thymidylate synthase